jgi:hypothetical protein
MLTLLLPSALAATLVVDGTTNGTITAAIADAEDGDTIEVVAGTYYECLEITESITLVGRDGSASTLLDGGGVCDMLIVGDVSVPLSISGFSLTAPGGQALVVEAHSLQLADLAVTDSGSAGLGSGAGLSFSGTELEISDSSFSGLTAQSCAALDLRANLVAQIRSSTFEGNIASVGAGGAICLASTAVAPASLNIEGSTFANNEAGTSGLAIELGPSARLSTRATTFRDNKSHAATAVGGAVQLYQDNSYSSTGDIFSGNGGTSHLGHVEGYAINAQQGGTTLTVVDGLFEDNYNSAHSSAAIEVGGTGTTLSVSDSSFRANNYSIVSNGPSITMEGNVFEDDLWRAVQAYDLTDLGSTFENSAANSLSSVGDLTLTATTFRGQTEYPALMFSGRSLSITDCLVEDNTMDGQGAFRLYRASGSATISGCTFARNINDSFATLEYGGAITWEASGTLRVEDSVFEDNSAYAGAGISSFGGALDVEDSSFTGNSAHTGGAIWVGFSSDFGWSGTPDTRVLGSLFEGNNATGTDGGAISQVGNGRLVVEQSFFVDNDAADTGGAIYAMELGRAELSNLYICGSRSDSRIYSGAVHVQNTELALLSYSILADNTGSGYGGALSINNVEETGLYHNTVVGGDASYGGGAYLAYTMGEISHSIFAHTQGGDALFTDDPGTAP